MTPAQADFWTSRIKRTIDVRLQGKIFYFTHFFVTFTTWSLCYDYWDGSDFTGECYSEPL